MVAGRLTAGLTFGAIATYFVAYFAWFTVDEPLPPSSLVSVALASAQPGYGMHVLPATGSWLGNLCVAIALLLVATALSFTALGRTGRTTVRS